MNSDFVVAIHAMVYLHHKSEVISSNELADNICTNPARVRRVMAKLKEADLVKTREGRTEGGYIIKNEKPITLADLGKAVEIDFANFSWLSGNHEKECLISSGMTSYIESLQEELNKKCMNYLNTIELKDVENILVKK